MSNSNFDMILVGGGLTNSLLAWQLKRVKPWLRFILIEKTKTLGGKHTWSFHETDLSEEAMEWVRPVISASWPFYQVIFPKYVRQLENRYYSIRSKKFHDVLIRELGEHCRFETEVASVSAKQVVLTNGEVLTSDWVVDGRGLEQSSLRDCAFQKFVGLEVELTYPHGLKGPLLMDASVKQEDGYRFFYCLPWSETRLLVEDTRYSTNPSLNVPQTRDKIMNYCREKNWIVKEVFDEETGCLPLPLNLNFFKNKDMTALTVGMRAGLFHPTTGYSLPFAVQTVESFLKAHRETQWASIRESLVKSQQTNRNLFVWLNRVMFGATSPESRFKFLQHFYRLPESLVHAFYAHRMTVKDWLRFFFRTPPVAMTSVLKTFGKESFSEA